MLQLLQFFRVAPPNTPLMTAAFGVTTVIAAAVVILRTERAADALMPILLLQLFAASSGFMVPARRGHYDLVLTSGRPRVQIGVVHWLMSIHAGALSWLLLALVEWFATGGKGGALVASGTVAAVLLVSTLPWAATIRLPRFSAAIGWLTALAVCATVLDVPHFITTPATPDGWLEHAVVATVFPAVLVGRDLVGRELLAFVPGFTASIAAMTIALRSLHRHDIPLEASQ